MKLKSLLFGSAAALATVTGAQAADLPVAAGPVDYVRVCDAAGTGFFYIPGTDVCLKVGGRVRAEYYAFERDNDDADQATVTVIGPGGATTTSTFGTRDRANEYSTRARGYINVDARADTDMGAIRAFVAYYITVGPSSSPTANGYSESPELDKAFVTIGSDFGTLTAGHASSFFDFFGGNTYEAPGDPTATVNLIGLTAEFSGFAASVSFEDSLSGGRRPGVGVGGQLVDNTTGTPLLNDDGSNLEGFAGAATGPQSFPDVVGHIRGDVGPFSAQVMGALHEVDGSEDDLGDVIGVGTLRGTSVDETALGWAAGLGFSVGIPDTSFGVDLQAAYADGAVGYVYGWKGPAFDAVATDADGDRVADIETTTAWGVLGGLTGGLGMFIARLDASYGQIDHAGEAADYTQMGIAGDLAVQPAAGLEIGIGVGWTDIEYDNETSAAAAGLTAVGADEDTLSGRLRVQYTF